MEMEDTETRKDLAIRSYWNIGYFISGFVFWVYVLVTAQTFPLEKAKIFWLVGTFLIFPFAVLSSRLIGADPFTKGNRLADLIGYTHMSVIALGLPLVLASFMYFPESMLLAMAILYCIDFYVMSWAFDNRLFGIHATTRVLLVSLVWFVFPGWRLLAIPAIVAIAYLVTAALILTSRKRWLSELSQRSTASQAREARGPGS